MPAIYIGSVTLYMEPSHSVLVSIPIGLEVWDIVVPTTKESKFQTVFSFSETVLSNFYNASVYNLTEIKYKFFDMLTSYRIPPDELYQSSPRPIDDYYYLSTVTQWMNIEDVQNQAANGMF